MQTVLIFHPPRSLGVLFHIILILLLAGAGLLGLLQASLAESGLVFLLFVLPSLLAFGLVPYLFYRVYSLWIAFYGIERDGIRLRWGLRYEEIPMDQILWVRQASELAEHLPLPGLRWPGSIAGIHRYEDGTILEFMASLPDALVVIATPAHMYAISPPDPREFLQSYRRLAELGSLSPLPARSVFPALLLSRSWADLPARFLILSSLLLSLALLAWVSLAVPQHPEIALRLTSSGSAVEYQPSIQLMLLPVLNTFFVLADVLLGLFFYRRSDFKPLAYLMWGTASLTPLLFMGAVFFLLRAS